MYWIKKISKNKKRDKLVSKSLKTKGWKVIRIWECDLKSKNILKFAKRIRLIINNSENNNI
jgi:DNA mismatch endonuclease (patch repair protein)